jgi:hypothetical protein
MNNKKFITFIFIFILIIYILAFILHIYHKPYTSNELILNYQEKKIDKLYNTNIQTIIVGDSSAGNAIDANEFTKLSNKKTINLSLTGSYGLIGSLNMIKNIHKKHPEIKNIIIMQTLDIWRRPLSKTSFFKSNKEPLLKNEDLINNIYFEYIKYIFNLKELKWAIKNTTHKLKTKIDLNHDYTKQSKKKFSNKKKRLKNRLLSKNIHRDNIKLLKAIDNYCSENKLKCIYLHGPLHETVVKNSQDTIKNINSTIKNNISSIVFLENTFAVEPSKLGDSNDHIDPKYKKIITKYIFLKIKNTFNE